MCKVLIIQGVMKDLVHFTNFALKKPAFLGCISEHYRQRSLSPFATYILLG